MWSRKHSQKSRMVHPLALPPPGGISLLTGTLRPHCKGIINLPEESSGNKPPRDMFCSKTIQDLGIELRPVEESLRDMAAAMIRLGSAVPKATPRTEV